MKLYHFSCPRCGASERFLRVDEERGPLSLLLLLTGHLLFALLADRSRNRIQCGNCLYIFPRPTAPRSPASLVSAAVFVVLSIAGVGFLILFQDNTGLFLRSYPEFVRFLGFLWEDPKSGILFLSIAAFALAGIALVFSAVFNSIYRRKLSQQYLMEPEAPAS
jgi:ribosomal protein S27AE